MASAQRLEPTGESSPNFNRTDPTRASPHVKTRRICRDLSMSGATSSKSGVDNGADNVHPSPPRGDATASDRRPFVRPSHPVAAAGLLLRARQSGDTGRAAGSATLSANTGRLDSARSYKLPTVEHSNSRFESIRFVTRAPSCHAVFFLFIYCTVSAKKIG